MSFENYVPMIVGSLILVLLLLLVARMSYVVMKRLLDTDEKARQVFRADRGPRPTIRQKKEKEDESRERWTKAQTYRRTTTLLILAAISIVLFDLVLVLLLTSPAWVGMPAGLVFIAGVGYLAYRYLRPQPFPPFPGSDKGESRS